MLGYRLFIIQPDDGSLHSPFVPWLWTPALMEARCNHTWGIRHIAAPCQEVPDAVHPCGFYCRDDFENPEWTKALGWVSPQEPIVLGVVWAEGKIVQHTDHVLRAEKMQILALAGNPRTRWFSESIWERAWVDPDEPPTEIMLADEWTPFFSRVDAQPPWAEARQVLCGAVEDWLRGDDAPRV